MSYEHFRSIRDPAEARTQDPQIKSLLLYQLSYGVDTLKYTQNRKQIEKSKLLVTSLRIELRTTNYEFAALPAKLRSQVDRSIHPFGYQFT